MDPLFKRCEECGGFTNIVQFDACYNCGADLPDDGEVFSRDEAWELL